MHVRYLSVARRQLEWVVAFAVVAAALATSWSACLADGVVCRKPRIQGFDREYERAVKQLPQTTSDLDSCCVYITRRGSLWYAHSNYVTPTPGNKHPTKLCSDEISSLHEFLRNLLFDSQPTAKQEAQATKAHKNSVKYYIDRDAIAADGGLALDLAGANNLYVVLPDVSRPVACVGINRIRGPPIMAARVDDKLNIYARLTSDVAFSRVLPRLRAKKFDPATFRLISIVVDSSTEAALKSPALQGVVEPLSIVSTAELKSAVARSRGRTVAILGHMEGERFISRDSSSQSILVDVSVGELETIAADHDVDVVYLGCSSAAEAPLGVARPFNPIAACKGLEAALASRSSDFAAVLSQMGLPFVVDERFRPTTATAIELQAAPELLAPPRAEDVESIEKLYDGKVRLVTRKPKQVAARQPNVGIVPTGESPSDSYSPSASPVEGVRDERRTGPRTTDGETSYAWLWGVAAVAGVALLIARVRKR